MYYKRFRTGIVAVIFTSLLSSAVIAPAAADGITWTSRTSTANIQWLSVAYGDGLFVAVSQSGTGNQVMSSPDGITWTSRTSAANNAWRSVAYGNGLWVAVSNTGTGNRVMTSPDGITWTSRTFAADNDWTSVAYGNGLWVAVSSSGTGNRVMTSPDGITWTSRTSAADNDWFSVAYNDGLWVAVSFSGDGNRVMTSGVIGLAARTTAAANAEAARVAAANTDAVASAESARRQKQQQELTEIFALIPKIGELTLSLGEITRLIITRKPVVSGIAKKQPIKVSASELKQIQKLGKTLALKIAESNEGSVNEGAVASFAEGVRILYGK